jgi:tRNA threonylcarbamoyladenosine biosynthesis protein TsaB
MGTSFSTPEMGMQPGSLLLAIDTCGPTGSVALGRLAGRDLEILGQAELEGRSYSATLVSAVGELLANAGVRLKDLGGMIAVNGPGSFTGVRVGLSAVKGLAETGGGSARTPVVAISRLLVLSRKSGVPSCALDAHRDEVFLRLEELALRPRELLAGAADLAAIDPVPLRVAVCDEAAAELLEKAWPSAQLVRCEAPDAKDALRLGEARLVAGGNVDLALLDGNYLRRSDAEIFGEAAAAGRSRA